MVGLHIERGERAGRSLNARLALIGHVREGRLVEVWEGHTDAESYGGSNKGNAGAIGAQPVASHGYAHSLPLTLPPLATLVLAPRD